WGAKLSENVGRDRRQLQALAVAGWRVLRVWEHELREEPERVVRQVLRALRSSRDSFRRQLRVVAVTETEDALERRVLEDLSDPSFRREEVSRRITRKTGRVRRTRLS